MDALTPRNFVSSFLLAFPSPLSLPLDDSSLYYTLKEELCLASSKHRHGCLLTSLPLSVVLKHHEFAGE